MPSRNRNRWRAVARGTYLGMYATREAAAAAEDAYRATAPSTRVPVTLLAPLVEQAVREHDELSWNVLAIRLWGERPDSTGRGDTTRLKRDLGLKPGSPATTGRIRRAISFDKAKAICDAAHIEPHRIGL